MNLLPHQERVVAEKADLDVKREKLSAFFNTPMFSGLPVAEQNRLKLQAQHMYMYSEVLAERVEAFNE